jgi:hypothetical protein
MRRLYIAFTQRAFESAGTLLPWANDLLIRYEWISQTSETVTLTNEAALADYILFVDSHVVGSKGYANLVRNSELYKAFREKVYVYDQSDNPRLGLPGLYVAMPKQLFDSNYMRSVPYVHYEIDKIDYVSRMSTNKGRFAIFIGDSTTAQVRRDLFKAQLDCVDKFDTSHIGFHNYAASRPSQDTMVRHVENYCDCIGSTLFSICPRGHGTSSFRFYESIMLGAIPVVLSDDFVPPVALSTPSSYVSLPERDTRLICRKLEIGEAKISQYQSICQHVAGSVLSTGKRLEYVLSELDRLANHKCDFRESTLDKIRHKIYWLTRKYTGG